MSLKSIRNMKNPVTIELVNNGLLASLIDHYNMLGTYFDSEGKSVAT